MVLDFDQIRALLPQAYPFLLLDRVTDLVPKKSIVALKNICGNEWMFPGHFPTKAVYPGVLLLESMAQASILLMKHSIEGVDGTFYMVGVRSRFRAPVVPGDQVCFSCEVEKMISSAGIIEAKAVVRGETVATAVLSFAVR